MLVRVLSKVSPSLIPLLGWSWPAHVPTWHHNGLEEDIQDWNVTASLRTQVCGNLGWAWKAASRRHKMSWYLGCPVMSFVRQAVRNYWSTVFFSHPVGLNKADFCEISQDKEQRQEKWEVLSILQRTSISTSHPCWGPLAAASIQSLLSQCLRETLLILEVHGHKSAGRLVLSLFLQTQLSKSVLTMFYIMQESWLALQPDRGSGEGRKVPGLRRAWELTYFAKIRPVLFYQNKIVSWHNSPPSAEMPQRHAQGLCGRKCFCLAIWTPVPERRFG